MKFDCGDSDLNDFFQNDVLNHERQLFTKTYCLYEYNAEMAEKSPLVGLISYSNDSVRIKDFKDHEDEIPEEKRYPNIPAVKIARLAIQQDCQHLGIGSLLLNLTKLFFTTNNRTGCRLLTLDACNDERVLAFYKRSSFNFIHEKDKNKRNRIMFYDLSRTPV
ncbi:MAG: hypothetical protein NTY51_07870 [Deltaproteobacteria bacterium]|nr:hypothetical protein [Deltaproteobacteria bacterium]